MVGNKIVAAIRSDGKVYSLEDGGGGVGVTSGSILNTNHGIFGNMANMKSRQNSGGQIMSDSSDIIMTNTRIQASVMDLGKKLLQCARDNDIDGVAAMMRKGAPFASDWLGMTAIHFAAVNNWYDICKLLVTSGINKDARTKVDRTPLHLAAFYGHERIVELLIEYRCALNPRDMLRMTPLHWAIEKRHKSIVRLLLKHNADVTAISKFGKTPVALAVLTEQPDILQELEAARKMQQSKKYNEEHEHLAGPTYQKLELSEKETNEAVNSIMGQVIDDDEPQHKKLRMTPEECKGFDSPTELSVDQFDTISDEKLLDSSAINLLKSHGISMIKDEDTSDNLLTTALQNGRQLVLSEGGKLLLNEARRMGGSKIPETVKTTTNSQNSIASVAPVKVKTPLRPNTISKAKEVFSKDPPPNNGNDKQYKNIRIISLNDFKKLYGTGNLKGLQKIETSLNKSQVVKIKSDDKHVYSRKKSLEENGETTFKQEDFENPDYEEENDLPPNIVKVSVESEQEYSSDVDTHQTAIIHPPVQPPPEPRLLPMRHGPAANNSRPTYTRPPSTPSTDVRQERTPVIPLLTIPEICRQLLELRKQNDELRRKYEIAQKEKEDFRNRLERLETLFLVEHAEEEYSEM